MNKTKAEEMLCQNYLHSDIRHRHVIVDYNDCAISSKTFPRYPFTFNA